MLLNNLQGIYLKVILLPFLKMTVVKLKDYRLLENYKYEKI